MNNIYLHLCKHFNMYLYIGKFSISSSGEPWPSGLSTQKKNVLSIETKAVELPMRGKLRFESCGYHSTKLTFTLLFFFSIFFHSLYFHILSFV